MSIPQRPPADKLPPEIGGEPSGLTPDHLADLRKSGLSADTIRAAGLYSERDARRVRQLLNWSGKAPTNLGPCLVFHYIHADGTRNGYVRLKPSKPRKDKKSGKPIKYEAPKGTGNRLYIPPGTVAKLADPAVPLLITEGEKKALAADQAGYGCLSIPGVWTWQERRSRPNGKPVGPRQMIADFDLIGWKGRPVIIVFDSDAAANPNVLWAEWHLADALAKRGATVRVVRLPGLPDPKVKVGLDDFLRVDGPDAFATLLKDAKPPAEPKRTLRPAGRRVVMIRTDEHRVISEVVEALAAADPNIYQRGGQIVRTVREPRPEAADGPAVPRIAPVPLADLRTRISRVVQLGRETKKGIELAHPPDWLAPGVRDAAVWPGIRPLEAVSPTPVLRADGTILQTPGYDPATGVVYDPRGDYPSVRARLTAADAAAAAAELCEVVSDFPFEAPEHKAAWLAGVLTPFARFAYRGPAPLFLVDANVRAAGKTLLADAAGIIAAESSFARRSYPTGRDRADEMRKAITALALSGERLVLLDNLPWRFGDTSLDCALTGTDWTDRILGQSQNVRLPLVMTWWATGNNVTVEGDLSRRVLPIRLLSSDERPEDRGGFRHPDLLAYVRQQRGRLVAAALSVLAAYIQAGRPAATVKPWGSFEGWSGLVRAAVIWAGLPDPRAACEEFASRADTEAAALGAMVTAWPDVDPDGAGMTVGKLLKTLKDNPTDFGRFREALAEFCPARSGDLPDAHGLGIRLRRFARRNVGGRWFDSTTSGKVAVWFVGAAGKATAGDAGVPGDGAAGPSHDAPARAHMRVELADTTPGSPASPSELDAHDRNGAWEGPEAPAFAGDGPYRERF